MTPALLKHLTWATAEQKKEILLLINGKTDPESYTDVQTWLSMCYNKPRQWELIMTALNQVCDTHGVESIIGEDDKSLADYLNTGDTYIPTIIYRWDIVKRWDIISLGDLVELLERKGIYAQ